MIEPSLPQTASLFFKRIAKGIKRTKLLASLFFCSFGQALYILLPLVLGVLIDKVFLHNENTFDWLLIFPAVWLISLILNSIGKFYTSSINQDVRKLSKEIVFRHIVSLPSSAYIDRNAGEVEHLMQEISFNSRYFFSESPIFYSHSHNLDFINCDR